MEQHNPNLTQENILFQYSAALERGDFEAVAAILQQAEDDPILAQMLFEVNEVYATEFEPSRSQMGLHKVANRIWRNASHPTRRNVTVAVAVMVLVLLFLPILPSSDPRILNVGLLSSVSSRTSVVSWFGQQVVRGQRELDPGIAAAPTPFLPFPPGQPTLISDYGFQATTNWVATQFAAMPTATPAAQAELATSSIIEVTPIGGPLTPTSVAGIPGSPAPSGAAASAQPQEQMIVKNGEIDLLVRSANTAIDQVTQIATDNGGYVLTSQTSLYGPARYATLTIAVRADMFETAMRRLRQSAIDVLRELSTGEDVSTEYVDLQSRLRNLEVTRDRIQTFLEDAKNVPEALEINRQLADIEAQIEQVKGRMTYLSGRSAFSTITVNIQEKLDATRTPTPTATPTPTPTPPWSLAPTFEDAAETQVNLMRGLLEVLTWLIVVPGPYCLAGGLVAWGIWAYNRRKNGPATRPPQAGP